MGPHTYAPSNQRQRINSWNQELQQHQRFSCYSRGHYKHTKNSPYYRSSNNNRSNFFPNPANPASLQKQQQQRLPEYFDDCQDYINHDPLPSTFSQSVLKNIDSKIQNLFNIQQENLSKNGSNYNDIGLTENVDNNDKTKTAVQQKTYIKLENVQVKQEPFVVCLPKPAIIKTEVEDGTEPVAVEINSFDLNCTNLTQILSSASSSTLTTPLVSPISTPPPFDSFKISKNDARKQTEDLNFINSVNTTAAASTLAAEAVVNKSKVEINLDFESDENTSFSNFEQNNINKSNKNEKTKEKDIFQPPSSSEPKPNKLLEKIINHKKCKGKLKFNVKLLNYSLDLDISSQEMCKDYPAQTKTYVSGLSKKQLQRLASAHSEILELFNEERNEQ